MSEKRTNAELAARVREYMKRPTCAGYDSCGWLLMDHAEQVAEALESLHAIHKALESALLHVTELEDAWRRGAIDERDGLGGTRSNRNIEVRNLIQSVMAADKKGKRNGPGH